MTAGALPLGRPTARSRPGADPARDVRMAESR